jgi:hypothetical protein
VAEVSLNLTPDLGTVQRYSFDKSIKCPRCELEDETNEHILKCSETILRYPEILHTASTILEREIDRVWNNNKMAQASYTKPTANAIWKALGAETISREIIYETLVDRQKVKEQASRAKSEKSKRNTTRKRKRSPASSTCCEDIPPASVQVVRRTEKARN